MNDRGRTVNDVDPTTPRFVAVIENVPAADVLMSAVDGDRCEKVTPADGEAEKVKVAPGIAAGLSCGCAFALSNTESPATT
jgi:hypothetical protein